MSENTYFTFYLCKRMKTNFQKPVLFFSLIFATLIVVQCYYLCNTAQLWKSEIFRTVRNQLDKLDSEGSSSQISADDIAVESIFDFENGIISKEDFLKTFRKRERKKTSEISSTVDKMFEKEGYEVAFDKKIMSIYSYQSGKQMISKPIVIFTTKNSAANGKEISTGKWQTSFQHRNTVDPKDNKNYEYLISSKTSFDILNINHILLKKTCTANYFEHSNRCVADLYFLANTAKFETAKPENFRTSHHGRFHRA